MAAMGDGWPREQADIEQADIDICWQDLGARLCLQDAIFWRRVRPPEGCAHSFLKALYVGGNGLVQRLCLIHPKLEERTHEQAALHRGR